MDSMKKINAALISVFYKDKLDVLIHTLHQLGVTIYSTGGTRKYIESINIPCVPVEDVTDYPSILGGRVKTLHPKVFGGILGRRNLEQDMNEMREYGIPEIDLVVVDLYPFEETVASTSEEQAIIEKIDIGGPSMIRAAAKNFQFTTVIASKEDYISLSDMLIAQNGSLHLAQRRTFAAKAFEIVKRYDMAIADYFDNVTTTPLRYGENPHQKASFSGDMANLFTQHNGKELSYNNLVDVDACLQLIADFADTSEAVFAIIKHTNVCGISMRPNVLEAWHAAYAGDPESAFGGVLISNRTIDLSTAEAIHEIFFEVLLAPAYTEDALQLMSQKKNRILLEYKSNSLPKLSNKTILNGLITQEIDLGNVSQWQEVGGRSCTSVEKDNLNFANIVCKHLKSNAIAIVKEKQLIGKGCGQTSRIDALRHAIDKARQFNADLHHAVLASDAFFPFDDCVRIAHQHKIEAFIQPGGSIRDKDSIAYCVENNLAMVMSGLRHFKH